jgi:hypothetical protein
MAEEQVLILDKNVQDAVDAQNELEEQQVAAEPENKEPEYEVPDKFKDKSIQDVSKSYEELEKKLGRQAQELGDTRKLADDLLRQELEKNRQTQAQQEEQPKEFDYDNPLESVRKIIQQELRPVRDELKANQDISTRDKLVQQHPDYMDIAASPEFSDWVNSSPIRADLYRRANDQLEYNAAVELLDTWKALNPAKETPSKAETQKVTKQKINELSTESGSTGQTSTKTFSRRELINLRATNPNKYYDMADEIRQAYSEGRVR